MKTLASMLLVSALFGAIAGCGGGGSSSSSAPPPTAGVTVVATPAAISVITAKE